MGITERRKREREQRKNEIIKAAEKVFAVKGKNLATMDDVAEQAELSKGTLYLYFKSKEELYYAISMRGLKILGDMFKKAIVDCMTGLEKVLTIGETYYQFAKDYPDYFNALIYFDSHDMDMEVQDSNLELKDIQEHDALTIVIDAIKIGINDGSISKNIDPDKAAVILWGQTTGLMQLIAYKGEHLEMCHNINNKELISYSFELIKKALQNS